MRRSFYAKKNIRKGAVITKNHIKYVRPKVKDSFDFNIQILGKKASRNIKVNFPITIKNIF